MIRIPTRFEHFLNQKVNPTPLILAVEEDLQAFNRLRRKADVQQGGLLSFLVDPSGAGKTTAVYSASSLLPDRFAPVVSVPHSVPLRGVPEWLRGNLPAGDGRSIPLLLDNREASDDTVGLGELMAALNGLLRSRPDVVALWPTTNDKWRIELRSVAERIGGHSLVPSGADLAVQGPAEDRWPDVLERLLGQFDQRFEDLALDAGTIERFQADPDVLSVGVFLERVRDAIAERVDEVQLAKGLPQLVFVVTSGSDVVGEANRLRRAGSLLVKAEELLAYSGRSGAADFWKARSEEPEHHLAYIISLFQARLTTMTPSAVGYACLEFGDPGLRKLAQESGMARNTGNADRTFQHTDFYKYLVGQTTFELTSGSKGASADSTVAAYRAIQRVSATRHKAINQALCSLAERNVPAFAASTGSFEQDLGQSKAFADAVISLDGQDQHLEFHHLSPEHCTASRMSAYIMGKLRTYGVQYNLVPL